MSDTQTRLDAIRAALHPDDVHHVLCATGHGRPKGPCDCHASRDRKAHEALDALAAELERVTAALQKISAGATGVTGIPDRDRLVGIKQEADRALAGGARAAQEGDV
jgi:hypothetical protein